MVENAALKYLGIYPEHVQAVDELCERACEKYGINSDEEVWAYVKQDFEELVYGGRQMSNEIIRLVFCNLLAAMRDHGVDEGRVDWYINGGDTHFYIDGEEQ